MEKETIRELFLQGIDCSQVVAGAFSQELGLNRELLEKVSACFGGGMLRGETCGAVTGALMVLGLRYGHSQEDDREQKTVMGEKLREFYDRFNEHYPSPICRDLLGHDISKPGELEKVLEKNLMMDLCPCVVERVIGILREMIQTA